MATSRSILKIAGNTADYIHGFQPLVFVSSLPSPKQWFPKSNRLCYDNGFSWSLSRCVWISAQATSVIHSLMFSNQLVNVCWFLQPHFTLDAFVACGQRVYVKGRHSHSKHHTGLPFQSRDGLATYLLGLTYPACVHMWSQLDIKYLQVTHLTYFSFH